MDFVPPVPLAAVTELMLDAICIVDADGHIVYASAACERIFGYTQQEMAGRVMIDMVFPADRERTQRAAAEIMSGRPNLHFENRYVRKDGRVVDIMWSARWSEADRLRIGVARDITLYKRAERTQAALYSISEAAHAAEDLPALFERIHQIIAGLLPAPGFAVALQEEDGRLGFPYRSAQQGEDAGADADAASALCIEVIRGGEPLLKAAGLPAAAPHAASWLCVPLDPGSGNMGALILRSEPGGAHYTESDKELLQFVSTQVATAIERKRLYAQLRHLAQHDSLTGLPNRVLLQIRLEGALGRIRRAQGRMALLYLDLNGFKQVNDSLGHAAGDWLLQEVARRLQACVRRADTVARIGGDEFLVVLEDLESAEQASRVAEKIRNAVASPVLVDGRSLHVVPSIGIALCPDHGDQAEQLLRYADQAMFAAKRDADAVIKV
ncbi:MAG: diguanylate cyclase [Nevskia sp.]|nr:diguanylate cyclase [Nevskia sp.]